MLAPARQLMQDGQEEICAKLLTVPYGMIIPRRLIYIPVIRQDFVFKYHIKLPKVPVEMQRSRKYTLGILCGIIDLIGKNSICLK